MELHLDSTTTAEEPTSPPSDMAPPIKIVYHGHTADSSALGELPLFALKYLAEGAANVVFSFHHLGQSTARSDAFKVVNHPAVGHVLRISKGIENSLTGSEIKASFDRIIAPMFKNAGLEHHLLSLQIAALPEELIWDANKLILSQPSSRGDSIPHDTSVGLLMQDMSSVPGESLSIEIKPKWLAQSPTAPEGSYRCRTCALHAQKLALNSQNSSSKLNDAYLCPFKLLGGKSADIQPYIQRKVVKEVKRLRGEPLDPVMETRIVHAITAFFAPENPGHKLLDCIRRLQEKCDPFGVLNREDKYVGPYYDARRVMYAITNGQGRLLFDRAAQGREGVHLPAPLTDNLEDELALAQETIARLGHHDRDLCTAMSLRDCSLYLRADYVAYEAKNSVTIEAKLGDLDLKSDRKISDWAAKEKKLINGLYYKGLGGGRTDRDYTEKCLVAEEWRARVPRHW